MTANDIISKVDQLKPNEYSTAQKLMWLTQADRQLLVDVILKRGNKIAATQPQSPTEGDLWLDNNILKRFRGTADIEGTSSSASSDQTKGIAFDVEWPIPSRGAFLQDGRVFAVKMANANTATSPAIQNIVLHAESPSGPQQLTLYWQDGLPIDGDTAWGSDTYVEMRYSSSPEKMTVISIGTYGWTEVFPYTTAAAELLFDEYAEEFYQWYLFTQIDLFNAEYMRYNNSSEMLNRAYQDLERRYNRAVPLPVYRFNI